MVLLIVNTLLIVFSFALIASETMYIRNPRKPYEMRFSFFAVMGIHLCIIGLLSLALSTIGSAMYEVRFQATYVTIAFMLGFSAFFLLVWLYRQLATRLSQSQASGKSRNYAFPDRLRRFSVYALVYAFTILFYVLYLFVYFGILR